MQKINIHEAKTNLSRLVDQAAQGESFVIAKSGKPMVKVSSLSTPESGQIKRLGFMKGEFTVPADFDSMDAEAIAQLFGAKQ
ncbi:MAG: type II toxin-antitoxin system prevent-host-death family antitoxin [Limnobacter sp.]|uniref:type II toxin-antitoxin system Phd/YefM family antitoxin n=1 Tax=Limnobacter sp. TaxID=2003368 RepID=UPI0032EE0A13